jgi:hypothetical protein
MFLLLSSLLAAASLAAPPPLPPCMRQARIKATERRRLRVRLPPVLWVLARLGMQGRGKGMGRREERWMSKDMARSERAGETSDKRHGEKPNSFIS